MQYFLILSADDSPFDYDQAQGFVDGRFVTSKHHQECFRKPAFPAFHLGMPFHFAAREEVSGAETLQ